ncbi:type II toxin-antitoxin system VapC family toxin [Chitinimonas koreensis]|uniref:type II toxin-antitoxin system VapC family toxin n=1 Tax=Chitinimonas koreensis TaxID=356302 RepID=UPI0004114A53|nr:type II toxin-antitoxin system VapC family toxin [Chitinimonas koreensis]QNM97813.1 type II toxin-antitoxin system VapC family toxin [Chitinimonas koreensis]
MRLLLDTHVLLWWLADPERLGQAAYAAIADPAHEIWVSAASGWEIAIKQALGKLSGPVDLPAELAVEGFRALAIDFRHTEAVRALPPLHGDPFDRMLVAQARTEDLVLVSADEQLRRYSIPLLWAA